MKDNFMARFCHNLTYLERVSFEQHRESLIQITLNLGVQFSEPVAKIFFFFLIYRHEIP